MVGPLNFFNGGRQTERNMSDHERRELTRFLNTDTYTRDGQALRRVLRARTHPSLSISRESVRVEPTPARGAGPRDI